MPEAWYAGAPPAVEESTVTLVSAACAAGADARTLATATAMAAARTVLFLDLFTCALLGVWSGVVATGSAAPARCCPAARWAGRVAGGGAGCAARRCAREAA